MGMNWPEALVTIVAVVCGSVVALAWIVRSASDSDKK